jgi:succinate-acetate transporter protein
MTALDATADGPAESAALAEEVPGVPAAAVGPLAGDPSGLGLACFIMGAVALGLSLVGVVPQAELGAPLAIILGATSMGLIITTIWSAALGQTAVAAIFGIFAAFWLSYFLLVTGLIRGWFGIAPVDVVATVKLFLITWLITVLMLTLATLRLPVAFTAVFVLVALTVLFVLLAYEQTPVSSGLLKTGGYVLLVAAAGGVYLFFNSLSLATGGKALPLGRPTLKG